MDALKEITLRINVASRSSDEYVVNRARDIEPRQHCNDRSCSSNEAETLFLKLLRECSSVAFKAHRGRVIFI